VAEARGKPSGRLIAAVALASGMTPLNSTMLSVALRPIGVAYGTSEAVLTQVLVTSYLITSIVMQAPGGKLGDLLGHRRALACGQVAFAVGSVIALLAPSLGVLFVARIAMGAAGAMIVPSAVALLRTELPPDLRGRAYGVFGANMALSAAIGPLIGGQLTAAFGWRSLFLVNLLLVPLSMLLAGRAPRLGAPAILSAEAPPGGRAPFDWRGTLLLALALSALVLGVGRGRDASPLLLGLGLVLATMFVMAEKRHPSPVTDLSLLREPVFLASGGVIALQNLAMFALLFELPATCARVLGASPSQTGRLLVAFMAPVVMLSPVAGRITDAIGARSVGLIGTVLAAAGVGTLLCTPLRSLSALVPGLVIFGVGLAFSGSPAQSAGMSAIPAQRSGVAAGMMATMRYLGGVAGTLVLGITLDDAGLHDQVQAHSAALAAHQSALLSFTVALVLAVGCAFFLPGKTRPLRAGASADA
jgi:MFS family permease